MFQLSESGKVIPYDHASAWRGPTEFERERSRERGRRRTETMERDLADHAPDILALWYFDPEGLREKLASGEIKFSEKYLRARAARVRS